MKLRAPFDLDTVQPCKPVWDVEINNTTRAYEQEQINRTDPDNHRDIDESDLDRVASGRYKTRRGVDGFIDRFMYELGSVSVFERTETRDEIYFRFLHLPDGQHYEVRAYCQ